MGISRSNSSSPAPRSAAVTGGAKMGATRTAAAKPAATGLNKSAKKDGWGDDDGWANF